MKLFGVTLIAGLLAAMSFPTEALTRKYTCDELVFDALTKNGSKRIQLCKSQGALNYNFGLTHGKSELDMLVPVTYTMLYPESDDMNFDLYQGEYVYTIYADRLLIMKGVTVLTTIDLQKPMINKMTESLLPYGVPVVN